MGALVSVVPPLSASAPSMGSPPLLMLPTPSVPFSMKLRVATIVAASPVSSISGCAVPSAKTELASVIVTVPEMLSAALPVFPSMVELTISTEEEPPTPATQRPLPSVALLPVTVTPWSLSEAFRTTMAPPWAAAVFPSRRTLVRNTFEPSKAAIAPPAPAMT